MADLKDFNFQSDFQNISGDGENKKNKKDSGINSFKLAVFIFLIALTWLFIILFYESYINYSRKYNKALSNVNYELKSDISRLNKINTNLVFFKKVSKDQVNVSYILYLLSVHRFGGTYIKSLAVNNGRVNISVFSLENGFAKSLNLMNDYVLYLNIYGLQMHTGMFRITSIVENRTGKNRGVIGGLASGRFRYSTK
ncbi:MAG: hypothetical protein ACYDDB_08665 [bacterium]